MRNLVAGNNYFLKYLLFSIVFHIYILLGYTYLYFIDQNQMRIYMYNFAVAYHQ